jgi:hypothetical protein
MGQEVILFIFWPSDLFFGEEEGNEEIDIF